MQKMYRIKRKDLIAYVAVQEDTIVFAPLDLGAFKGKSFKEFKSFQKRNYPDVDIKEMSHYV